ncbi:ribosomal protein S18-alanine N-acetyltransferase [Marinobacter sp. DUT-3]|uniref:ribosomal protein S18-alanine N-acetyltransferase n=1 Tax=Marinobacter sp. DUT-3 TaxID=3412036 RepID=UPI003D169A5A
MTQSQYDQVRQNDRVIRPLLPDDLPAVLDIELRCYSHPWSESVFRDCFRQNYRLWAYHCGGALSGYAIVAYLYDEAHLLNLCIAPDIRGEGAGRQLLRHLLAYAAHDGMQQVILEVRTSNRIAAALYQSEGFRVIGERPGYYPAPEGREDAIVMAFGLSGA